MSNADLINQAIVLEEREHTKSNYWKSKTTRTITEQTGWKRPHPQTVCQSFEIKLRVTEYDYQEKNTAFQEYCLARGFNHLLETTSGYIANYLLSKEAFFDDEGFRTDFYYRKTGKRAPRLTDEAMEIHWKIICAARGGLQDLYELYQQKPLVTRGLAVVA